MVVFAKGQALACLAWVEVHRRHLVRRPRFIAWGNGSTAAQHQVILLASYPISDSARGVNGFPQIWHRNSRGRWRKQMFQGDWQRVYSHPVYLWETFGSIRSGFRGTLLIARQLGGDWDARTGPRGNE